MTDVEKMPSGWRCFHRRLIVTINGLFLVTMTVFLTASYFSEQDRHFRTTFRHLDETLGVLADQVRQDTSASRLGMLDDQLAEKTGVPHRLMVVRSNGLTEAAPIDSLVDHDLGETFDLRDFGDPGEAWFIGRNAEGTWLGSSIALEDGGSRRLLLMKLRPAESSFARIFVGFHGLHLLVTLLLFTALLEVVGRLSIRGPIEELKAHIEQLESGRFEKRPEIARDDELGWLARRFTRMSERLQELLTRRVRAEKYSSSYASAWKTVQQMMMPLHSFDRDLLSLEKISEQDESLRTVVTSLREDHTALVDTVRGLLAVELPGGVDLTEDP